MPKQIVSGNLNTYGNTGQFETDRSTWGFADSDFTVVRSMAQKSAGLYSALVTKSSTANTQLLPARYSSALGKKYIFRVKVRVPTGTPVAADGINLTLAPASAYISGVILENTTKTVLEAKDTWVQLEAAFEHNNALFPTWNELIYVRVESDPILNGQIYIDEFEIFEYIDVEAPDECDVDLDEDNTDVTNETSNGAGDGSIDAAALGTGPFEYSKDGAAWQGATLFAGLTTSIQIIRVRQQALISCVDQWPFAVNYAAVTHDFTTVVTDESISGAGDGAIVITPTGTGGPFNYTIDAGVNWQAGNSFTGLAPGVYYVAVRNAAGNSVVKVITVGAGAVEVDKIYHSKNPITFGKAAAGGWDALENYRLYNEVRVEDVADSGTYVTKLKCELPPDSADQATFYLRPAFRGVFGFTPPTLNHSSIIRLTDRIKRFKNFSGDITGTEIVPGVFDESLPNLVLYGGIDKFHFPGLNYFTDYLPTNKKFLTWAPVEKYVDRTQEDYLNFFVFGNYTTLKLRCKVYFDDETDETANVTTIAGTKYSELYQIPAGPANCGALAINPAKNAIHYELSLLNQSDAVISEVRTYYLVPDRHPLTRFFMFLNSLGAYEVLRFTGQAVKETEPVRDISQKFLRHDYAALDGEFSVNSAILQRKHSYSSGYQRDKQAKEWHEYLQDFIMSPRIYDVTTGLRIPVVITSARHTTEDQNYDRFIRFEAKPAYDDESFTPEEI
jgi:hypothetical protein